MRGKLWLKYFIMSLQEKEKTDYPNEPDDDAEWTNFLKKVLENAGKKMNCHVVQILPEIKTLSLKCVHSSRGAV